MKWRPPPKTLRCEVCGREPTPLYLNLVNKWVCPDCLKLKPFKREN